MKKALPLLLLLTAIIPFCNAQQIRINFANNLIDSSNNHYLIDTNNCGNILSFCSDASGNANNAYQFDGLCGMSTDSFSMTNTVYNGFSVSFYMSKSFDSSVVQYGILHFYKGNFLIYALHDSMFVTVTDSSYADHTFGVPCTIPNDEWFCTVVTFTDFGSVDFYFNKTKFHAGTASFKSLRKECIPGFCYPLNIATNIWDNEFFKGKLDDIRVWNWPSDSVNVDEICTKSIIPASLVEIDNPLSNLSPNPANTYVNLTATEAGTFYLYDLTGRLLLHRSIDKGSHVIPLGGLTSGLYQIIFRTVRAEFRSRLQVN